MDCNGMISVGYVGFDLPEGGKMVIVGKKNMHNARMKYNIPL